MFDNASTRRRSVREQAPAEARGARAKVVGDQIRCCSGDSSREAFVVAGAIWSGCCAGGPQLTDEECDLDCARSEDVPVARPAPLFRLFRRTRPRPPRVTRRCEVTGHGRRGRSAGRVCAAAVLAALDWRDHAGALSEKQEKQKERSGERRRTPQGRCERNPNASPRKRASRRRSRRASAAAARERVCSGEAGGGDRRRGRASARLDERRSAAPPRRRRERRRDVAGSDSEDARGRGASDDDFFVG